MENSDKLSRRELIGGLAIISVAIGFNPTSPIVQWILKEKGPEVKESIENVIYPADPNKHAILVQQDPKRKDDSRLMNKLLKPRGYNIIPIEPLYADKGHVISAIERLAGISTPDSQTIFYFSGHGRPIDKVRNLDWGITLKPFPDNGIDYRMTAYELLSLCGSVQGKKAIIIDSCHSGTFVEEAKRAQEDATIDQMINNYVILAACSEEALTGSSNTFIEGKHLGPLTSGLYSLLNDVRTPIDLSKTAILYGNEGMLNWAENEMRTGKISHPIEFKLQRTGDTSFFL